MSRRLSRSATGNRGEDVPGRDTTTVHTLPVPRLETPLRPQPRSPTLSPHVAAASTSHGSDADRRYPLRSQSADQRAQRAGQGAGDDEHASSSTSRARGWAGAMGLAPLLGTGGVTRRRSDNGKKERRGEQQQQMNGEDEEEEQLLGKRYDSDSDVDGEEAAKASAKLPAKKAKVFIKLIGKPHIPAGKVVEPDPAQYEIDAATGFQIKSPLPGRPPTPDLATVVDLLDAENEDPFTLESFRALLDVHESAGKDFIVARVTTVDPSDAERLYYSYYAAHHINKVLFRTQPEEGLLHRMKAKNPLNNMTIVGDVHYYVIRVSGAAKQRAAPASPLSPGSPKRPSSAASFAYFQTKFGGSANASKSAGKRRVGGLFGLEAGSKPPADLRRNILRLQLPYAEELQRVVPLPRGEHGDDQLLHLRQRALGLSEPHRVFSSGSERPRTADPAAAIKRSNAGKQASKTAAPEHRVVGIKALSFLNDVGSSTTKGSSSTSREMIGWIRRHFDQQPSISLSNSSRKSGASGILKSRKTTPTAGAASGPQFIEAHFYATDDDFLMQARVRTFFKESALSSDDAVLFTISQNQIANPPGAGEGDAAGAPHLAPHPALPGFRFGFVTEDDDLEQGGNGGLMGPQRGLFAIPARWRRNPFFPYAVGITAALLAVVIIISVPSEFRFLAAVVSVPVLLFLFIMVTLRFT